MKIKQYLTIILLATLLACSDDKQNNNVTTFDQVFTFGMTTDPNFCSRDSVLETECSSGNLFLTNKGNVIVYFYCPNRDSSIFHIGTYKLTKEGVACSFNKMLKCPQCQNCPMECLLEEGEIYEELLLKNPHCEPIEYCAVSRKTRSNSRFIGFIYARAHPNDNEIFRQLIGTSEYLRSL